MRRLEGIVNTAAQRLNWVACAAIIVMMALTCADVVLRFFHRPIPGTYELVGFIGSVVVSLALAYTSVERGHIAVEILVQKLPERTQRVLEGLIDLIGAALFGVIAWTCALYAADFKNSGEVSLTLGVPTYPFVYGISLGCAMLCIVLMTSAAFTLKRASIK